jgi:crossover junction endodeoxyribonuclease RuvC
VQECASTRADRAAKRRHAAREGRGAEGGGRIRILGIDPGSSATGFGLVERTGSRVLHLAHGTLRPPRGSALPERLAFLYGALAALLAEREPDGVAVERVFVAASPRAALVLGHARGVVLAAAGAAGLRVSEYAPSEVKLAATGSGSAAKAQVQAMVQRLLALATTPPRDAADALAVALCHAQAGPLAALLDGRATQRGARRSGVRVLPAGQSPAPVAPANPRALPPAGRLVVRRVR